MQSVLKKTTGVNNLTFKNTFCCRRTQTWIHTLTLKHKDVQRNDFLREEAGGYDGLSQINGPSQVKQQ